MHAATRDDPQTLTSVKLGGCDANEAAKAGPAGIGDPQIIGQACLAGLIESIGPFPEGGHLHALLILTE
jgi:hypothetical protein